MPRKGVGREDESARQTGLRGAQTVGRAFRLLKCFVERDGPWTLTEIVNESGLEKSAAYRMLREMEAEGLIAHLPESKGYRIGGELIVLATRVLDKVELKSRARAVLENLSRMTGETVTLNMRVGSRRVTIDGIESPNSLTTLVAIGDALPLYSTPSGRAILALLPDVERDAILNASGLSAEKLENIRRELDVIRTDRFVLAPGDRRTTHSVFAVPVFSDVGVVAAIAVYGPSDRWNKRVIDKHKLSILRRCKDLSSAMGYREAGYSLV